MSTAPSLRKRNRRIERLILLLVTLAACGGAWALKSDRNQVINVNADHSFMSQDQEKAILTGRVQINQGSLHADGDKGVGYFNDDNVLQRVVLTGVPAHFQQKLDNGSMVHGSAATIDYMASENTVILTGNAIVVQQGRGDFHGEQLTYNTDTGEIVGTGGTGGQVHMTFLPKPKPAKPGAKKQTPAAGATIAPPASASASASAGAGAPPGSGTAASSATAPAGAASAAMPARTPAASPAPASASTAGSR
jgi:lipopolysaccharide export system protein LptA